MPRSPLTLLVAVLLVLVAACEGPDMSLPTTGAEAEEEEGEEESDEGAGTSGQPTDAPVATGQSLEPVELTAELLADRIDLATTYLLDALGPDGRFVYRINLSGEIPEPAYNVLRHAGTVYSLGQAHERNPDPELADAIARSTGYLIDRYVREPVGRFEWLAVFSRPDEEPLETGRPEAKLGGTGLALLAIHAARAADSDVGIETMTRLGDFMLFMQQGDGRFHSKFSESEGYLEFESQFYPGEAILGFIKLYEADPDPRWLDAAASGTAHLVESRRDTDDLPSDHWLMLGMESLLGHLDQLEDPPISHTEIQEHMLQLGNAMIRDQEEAAVEGASPGSFRVDGLCTATATRLEGLSALWRSMSDWGLEADRERVAGSIRSGVEFLLTCQVLEGDAAGGVVRAQQRLESEDDSFNRRQSEIRIDQVQHALSAMLGSLEAVFEEAPEAEETTTTSIP